MKFVFVFHVPTFTSTFLAISVLLLGNVVLSSPSPSHPYTQAVHMLDPDIPVFKYYNSWNSDQWTQWVRNRFIEGHEHQRNGNGTKSESGSLSIAPFFGTWVNIIVISSPGDMNSAFSELSERAYPDTEDETKVKYYWSDVPFSVFVVVRKSKHKARNSTVDNQHQHHQHVHGGNDEIEVNMGANTSTNNAVTDEDKPIESHYNVFNCAGKKMFINAKLDLETFHPVAIQNFFPKKVKNPKEMLRIPLVVCIKVSQVRGLLDEIKFQLGN